MMVCIGNFIELGHMSHYNCRKRCSWLASMWSNQL